MNREAVDEPAERVDPAEAIAGKLLYTERGGPADRGHPLAAAWLPGQLCANCAQWKGPRDRAWGPCTIFYGRPVAAEGWCTVWSLMSSEGGKAS